MLRTCSRSGVNESSYFSFRHCGRNVSNTFVSASRQIFVLRLLPTFKLINSIKSNQKQWDGTVCMLTYNPLYQKQWFVILKYRLGSLCLCHYVYRKISCQIYLSYLTYLTDLVPTWHIWPTWNRAVFRCFWMFYAGSGGKVCWGCSAEN